MIDTFALQLQAFGERWLPSAEPATAVMFVTVTAVIGVFLLVSLIEDVVRFVRERVWPEPKDGEAVVAALRAGQYVRVTWVEESDAQVTVTGWVESTNRRGAWVGGFWIPRTGGHGATHDIQVMPDPSPGFEDDAVVFGSNTHMVRS